MVPGLVFEIHQLSCLCSHSRVVTQFRRELAAHHSIRVLRHPVDLCVVCVLALCTGDVQRGPGGCMQGWLDSVASVQ